MKKILKIGLLISFLFILPVYAKENTNNSSHISSILSIFSFNILINIFFAFLSIIISIIISRIINTKIINYIENKLNNQNKEELIGVFTRVSNITFITLGLAIALDILGVDMGIFMGGLGFGLGFTLKIFLSNFIAGVIMVTQGNYHNGDLVKIDGKIGYIRKINSLFTEIEQFDGVIFYVPNVKFLENNVENFHINDKRRIEINIGVDYSTDLVKAKKVIIQVLNNFPEILKAPEPEVIITGFKDSSINLNVRFWIDSKGKYFVTKSNVTETINLAFKQVGITIPFPQITLSSRENFKINLGKTK